MERVFPVSRKVTRIMRPIVSRVTSMPVASESVFTATSAFYERLESVRTLLTNADSATVRLVVNPERLVVAEARRTATYLNLYGYRLDAVIANRLLPDEIVDPWFKAWKETHAEHLASICDGFAPVPVLRADLASTELIGCDALAGFAAELYRDVDAASVLHHDEPLCVTREGDGYAMRVALPFADRDDLELGRHAGELLIRVGPHRRAMLLPDSLAHRQVTDASLRDGHLVIRFGEGGTHHG
jgi:arsenite-transporting ATPase